MTQEHDAERGRRMDQLNLSEPFTDACDTLTENYVNRLLETEIGDTVVREECYRRIRVIEDIQTQILSIINDGKMASAQIEERNNSVH
jgi:hypothetical protein|tara:strand:- start:3181 stop:3444 length:264 start_codon:yes stop_codon:yes gene_type:complete